MAVPLPKELDGGAGHRARLGLIVLQNDLTLEAEMASLGLEGVAVHHSKIRSDAVITEHTLADMERRIPGAADLLPPTTAGLSVIGYACTSASTVIGEVAVANAIATVRPGVPVTNPIRATIEAFQALNAKRIGVVTPYSAAVTGSVIDCLTAAGLSVTLVGSFFEEDDLRVGRISERSVADAVIETDRASGCDAVFISCTNVRTFGVIDQLERQIDKPVVSSNIALAWHMLRLAGVDEQIPNLGRLLQDAGYRPGPTAKTGPTADDIH